MKMIDGVLTMGQKIVMTCLHSPTSEFRICARANLALRALLLSVGVMLVVMAFRHPVSNSLDPLAALEIKKQFLAGSDALLERGVIPPNRPDWIMMDCSQKRSETSTYNRLRQAICEVSGKTQQTVSITN